MGLRRLSNNPGSHANSVFFTIEIFSGICQKAHAKSMIVKIFALPILERLSSILGNGNTSLTVTSFSGRKSQQKRSSPFVFFTMTIPVAHGEKEGWIKPKANKFRLLDLLWLPCRETCALPLLCVV